MTLKVYFRDVQHGHSTIIITPNNRCLVIDLGKGDHTAGDPDFSPLLFIKNKLGFERVDFLTITHPHKDHIDDIENLQYVPASTLLRPRHLDLDKAFEDVRINDRRKFDVYREIDDRYNHPVADHNRLDETSNWGGVEFKTFHPRNCPPDNINNHSIITVFEYEGVKFVVPGDNEPASFEELFQNPNFGEAVADADILLAPHHGRQSGFYQPFVQRVSPRITIVSDGRFCDTSANSRYSSPLSSGWPVTSRSSGERETRYCLTTNSDGHVEVLVAGQPNGTLLNVSIE